jgi:taspase (threonine aspartase 1)
MIIENTDSVDGGDTGYFGPRFPGGGVDVSSIDGTTDKLNRRWKPPIAAIFIHAGAGYHSTANERVHLEACSE